MATFAPVKLQIKVQYSGGTGWMDMYDDSGRPVTVWKNIAENTGNLNISSWSSLANSWGSLNGKGYGRGDVITAKDLNAAVSDGITNSYEPTRIETTKRFDDFLAISAAKSQDLAHNGNCRCEAVPYTPGPDAESEPDTPLVPTDVQVPDNFRVEEYFCVRMHFDRFGDFEDDTELWSTQVGAQGRIRQILFSKDDVVSCEVVAMRRRETA